MRVSGKFIALTGLKEEKIVIEPLDIVAMIEHTLNGSVVLEVHTRHGIRINVEQTIDELIEMVEEWRLDQTAESISEWASKSHIREIMRQEKEKCKAKFIKQEKEDSKEMAKQIIDDCDKNK